VIKVQKKHLSDGGLPYDVYLRGGGMLRGKLYNNIMLRLFTYVADDQLFDNQRERQEEMTKEYYQFKRKGYI
jgi:hypothetical protein